MGIELSIAVPIDLLCSLNLKERAQGHPTQSSASQPLKARIFVFDKPPKKGNSSVSLIANALASFF